MAWPYWLGPPHIPPPILRGFPVYCRGEPGFPVPLFCVKSRLLIANPPERWEIKLIFAAWGVGRNNLAQMLVVPFGCYRNVVPAHQSPATGNYACGGLLVCHWPDCVCHGHSLLVWWSWGFRSPIPLCGGLRLIVKLRGGVRPTPLPTPGISRSASGCVGWSDTTIRSRASPVLWSFLLRSQSSLPAASISRRLPRLLLR